MALSVSLSRTEKLEELTGSYSANAQQNQALPAFPAASALPGGDGVGRWLIR